jgi:hypothetical protein
MPARRVGIMLKGEKLQSLPEYFVQHPWFCMPLLILMLLRYIVVLDWNRQESDHYHGVC